MTDTAPRPTPSSASAPTSGASRKVKLSLSLVRLGPLLMLAAIIVIMTVSSPVFFTTRNLGNVGLEASVVAILALGQLMVIITAGIDLSLGSLIALTSITGALWIRDFDIVSGWLMIPTMILTGGLAGAISGTLFVKGRIPHPFLPTLAMYLAARGVALLISGGTPITGMPDTVRNLGSARIGDLPIAVLLVAALGVLVHLILSRVTWGQWIYAIGSNREGARRVGIPVDRVLISVYVLSGMSAGVAAIVVSGQTNSAYPTAGLNLELYSIAAVIIGGASFFGGRGTVIGALVGALILGVIRNGLNLLGVDTAWQLVALGVVVVLAVELDVLRGHLETKLRTIRTDEKEA